MRFDISASGGDDYGDDATVRILFADDCWIEVEVADAWDFNKPRDEARPYGQGATITVHDADGTERVVWEGRVMPGWFAQRQASRQ